MAGKQRMSLEEYAHWYASEFPEPTPEQLAESVDPAEGLARGYGLGHGDAQAFSTLRPSQQIMLRVRDAAMQAQELAARRITRDSEQGEVRALNYNLPRLLDALCCEFKTFRPWILPTDLYTPRGIGQTQLVNFIRDRAEEADYGPRRHGIRRGNPPSELWNEEIEPSGVHLIQVGAKLWLVNLTQLRLYFPFLTDADIEGFAASLQTPADPKSRRAAG